MRHDTLSALPEIHESRLYETPGFNFFAERLSMTSFAELDVRPDILRGIAALGFTDPTPIQEKVIPLILANRQDLISLAQTGTGKTAAFGIPLVQLVDSATRQTQALVLCPTRELCIQVSRDLEALARYAAGIKVLAVYGGASIERQVNALKRGVQIIVATPGRLLDLIRRGSVHLAAVSAVVLDEADEMLNMGFQEELNAILAQTPATKNTLLFSATMPKGVAAIARQYMNSPAEITIGQRNAGADNVRHLYYMVQARKRYLALKRIVDSNPDSYGIIFCRTRQETKEVAEKLAGDGYGADALHGDLSQSQRDHIMARFRARNIQLLVATDVAARGLDVSDLTHVINYNLPDDIANYTHRSGRTGRAGKTGIAISIIHMRERHLIRAIEKKINKTFEECRVPSGMDICKIQILRHLDRVLAVPVDEERLEPFLPAMAQKLSTLDRDALIKRLVSLEFNRIFAYYQNAPDLNESLAGKENGSKRGRKHMVAPSRSASGENVGTFTRFALNIGKKDGVRPVRLIGMINERTGVRDIAIGKIAIMEKRSLMEVDSRFTNDILEAFQNLMMNGRHVTIEITGQGGRNGQKKDLLPHPTFQRRAKTRFLKERKKKRFSKRP